jgi:hypothetical protein
MMVMDVEEREDEASRCPFLTPKLSGPPAAFSTLVYCRHPDGRVRIPPRDQLMVLCTLGHHHDCPGYRRWRSRAMAD